MNFSQWLQEEMQKNNLTEYRIAKLSGVHQTTIKNLLSGTKPQIGTEEKIKRAIERINSEKQKNPDLQTEAGEEEELLQLFRLLPDDLKAGILAQIKAVLVQRGLLPSQPK